MTGAHTTPRGRLSLWWGRRGADVFGLSAIVGFVIAYISPAFKDGGSFGSFDTVISFSSLGAGAYPGPPHNILNGDSVSLLVAYNAFDWNAIHHLHFPLWNDMSLLGLPQFLNFQSAVLSLPDLVSYLAPLRFAYLVAVAIKLLIAGTGVYALCRVLGLRPLSSAFGGVIFMLSGAFSGWLTWSLSDVVSWTGWIAALVILAYRWKGRRAFVVLLAFATAFCVYGGFPEAYFYVAGALVVLFAVMVVLSLISRRRLSLLGVVRVGTGIVAGGALSAPLWLPGLKVISEGHRSTLTRFSGLPAHTLSLLVAPGYFGLPIKGSTYFASPNYYETVAYVGVIALVLAGAAVIRWWRHPMVVALALTSVVVMIVSYQTKSFHVVSDLLAGTKLDTLPIGRIRAVLGLPLGVLSALGLETLLRARGERRMLVAYVALCALVAAGVAVLWYWTLEQAIPLALHRLRLASLLWPTGLLGACALAGILLLLAGSLGQRRIARGTAAAAIAVLAGAESAFLLFAGVGINSYSQRFYPTTPAITQLKATVGSGLIGLDTGDPSQVQRFANVGIYPNANLSYKLAEYVGHDPTLPQSYFKNWSTAPKGGLGGPGVFEPDIDSAALAREYGIAWILQPPGAQLPAPPGTTYAGSYAGERLYRVPGSARFSLIATGGNASAGTVDAIRHTVASSWSFDVDSKAPATLVIRVTDTPGWHASIDGKPLQLSEYQGLMLAAAVPAGSHTILLWYLPERFVIGGWLALGVLVVLLGWAGWPLARRRPRPEPVREDLGASFAPGIEAAELASRSRGAAPSSKKARHLRPDGEPSG